MPSNEDSIRGGVHACQRCRRRKQKCDQRYPQCSNCESVNVACLTYHSGKKANIPRDHITNLEEQIAELTQEVQHLRRRRQSGPVVDAEVVHATAASTLEHDASVLNAERKPVPDESSPVLQSLVASVENVVVQPGPQTRYLGQSSGISFAKMVLAAVHVDRPESLLPPQQRLFQEIDASSKSKASLPPSHVAAHLIKVYFQYRTPHLPILDHSQVNKAINSAYHSLEKDYSTDSIPERDLFIAYMVFAIALVDIPHLGGRSSQSDACFRSGLVWVENILTYAKSDLETLRIVLLLAQFVALSPSQGSLWHLTGFALRLCIDMGLHWETESQCLNMDAELLNDRRRLWHTTYHFDRLMSITLGRPLGIHDENARVQLPNPWIGSRQGLAQQAGDFHIHTHRAHNHLFTLARLESEIKHVQHGQTWGLKLAYPRPNWKTWLQDIQPRLQEWYASIPEPSRAHPQSIFAFQSYWDVIYHNAVLLLYRPHTNTLYQSAQELLISYEASAKVIAGLKVLQREGRVEMLWKSVHHLFMAGLVIIYGLWQSAEIRDQNPVSRSITILQSCASTLSAMSETFKGASGCRNAFESLSTATIDWLVTKDIEDMPVNRVEFENQVRDLMDQLKSSRDEARPRATYPESADTPNMLFAENFDLSELLNAAAQWPDLGEFDFITGGQDIVMNTSF